VDENKMEKKNAQSYSKRRKKQLEFKTKERNRREKK